MSRCVLIDNEKLCFIKAAKTLEQCQYWADILLPKSDYLITGADSNRAFSVYSPYELRVLYYNTTGEAVPESIDYSKLISGVRHLAENLLLDETTIEQLREQLGHERKAPKLPPKEKNDKPAPLERGAGGTTAKGKRPKEGSTTGKVWNIADEMVRGGAVISKELRAEVIKACEDIGINSSTASTQYGKWKKFVTSDE